MAFKTTNLKLPSKGYTPASSLQSVTIKVTPEKAAAIEQTFSKFWNEFIASTMEGEEESNQDSNQVIALAMVRCKSYPITVSSMRAIAAF